MLSSTPLYVIDPGRTPYVDMRRPCHSLFRKFSGPLVLTTWWVDFWRESLTGVGGWSTWVPLSKIRAHGARIHHGHRPCWGTVFPRPAGGQLSPNPSLAKSQFGNRSKPDWNRCIPPVFCWGGVWGGAPVSFKPNVNPINLGQNYAHFFPGLCSPHFQNRIPSESHPGPRTPQSPWCPLNLL